MYKALSFIVAILVSSSVFAFNDINTLAVQTMQSSFAGDPATEGLNLKVGDKNTYNLKMGFMPGSMVIWVREIIAEGVWIQQDVDLGFMGKQKIETLLDPNTGQIKKMLVNGQEQQIPESDIEIVEAREDQVTVPAGSFKCIYFKIHDKKQNQDMQQWVNLKEIPINGMLKSQSPSQVGDVTMELTKFERGR